MVIRQYESEYLSHSSIAVKACIIHCLNSVHYFMLFTDLSKIVFESICRRNDNKNHNYNFHSSLLEDFALF